MLNAVSNKFPYLFIVFLFASGLRLPYQKEVAHLISRNAGQYTPVAPLSSCLRFEERTVVRPKTHVVVGIRAIIVAIRIPNSCIRRVVPIVGNKEAHVNVLPICLLPAVIRFNLLYPSTDHATQFIYHQTDC